MQIASNRLGGATINVDPCISVWANFSLMAEAATFSPTIFFSGGNAIFQASVKPMSHGDEPDTPLYAPTIGPAFFPMGIPTILLNGIPAIAMLSPCISNAGNAQGAVLVPSATNVYMLFDAEGTGNTLSGRVTADEMVQVSTALTTSAGSALRWSLTEERIGVIAIDVFARGLASALYGAVRELEARGAESLIIDLRGNPGGDVFAAIEAASDFLPSGTLVATLIDEDDDETDYRARAGAHFTLPLVIVVDGETASSAELFAGALQAHDRAIVFGPRTVGKGTAQRIIDGKDGSGPVWETFATVRLPNNQLINGVGIVGC